MKFSIIRCLIALIYILFMVKIMTEGNIQNGKAIVLSLINIMLILIAIFNTDIILPKQFTPLHELGVFGRAWRMIFAGLAVLWVGVVFVGLIYGLIIGKSISVGQLLAVSIFVFVGYAGFRMLTAK
ncbi:MULTISPECIES: hypothetical protein [Moraxella]|jgi:hypothetical protein|uniref:Uncharacterized protein n=1 Tax=Moraxella lacunata TaxID=477 RepID=A0A1B8PVC0_MORLA|nr:MULTISPECIES: hypothetical protein [Moraxella]MBE9579875.1 hypothetical protein [Moraxella sp. K1664]MBE9589203.1 hypothetical protein [Moraxella sp. K1630]MBE9597456.1 hypothetical protein [Moraxella sp. K2450]MDH9219909.1 hypothetical protein [Moraxella lacunata]MDI4484009.1 hypothetical protein [Moraxella lacunata]